MAHIINGEFVEPLTLHFKPKVKDAIRWIGRQDPRRLSMDQTIREWLWGNSVHECHSLNEAVALYEKHCGSDE